MHNLCLIEVVFAGILSFITMGFLCVTIMRILIMTLFLCTGTEKLGEFWSKYFFVKKTLLNCSFFFCRAMDNGMQESLLTCGNNEEVGDLKERIFEESSKIWKVALPGILSRVASFGSVVVTQSFIGHVGELELAGYALVQTLSVRFINGILVTSSN